METLYKSITCIALFYDGEPTLLYVDYYDKESVALKPLEGPYHKTLWFPRSMIFAFDLALFDKLKQTYIVGGTRNCLKNSGGQRRLGLHQISLAKVIRLSRDGFVWISK